VLKVRTWVSQQILQEQRALLQVVRPRIELGADPVLGAPVPIPRSRYRPLGKTWRWWNHKIEVLRAFENKVRFGLLTSAC
jgi:hypothetical protein